MRIGFVYDILENVLASNRGGGPTEELATELFTSQQANELIAGLKGLGHEVHVIDGADKFASQVIRYCDELDFVFNEAKGLFGPDRKMVLPALCRIYGIPYLGSDAYAVTLSRNKWHTLGIAAFAGIPIPASQYVESRDLGTLASWRHFPAIVKPNFESASIGISDASVVHDVKTLRSQVSVIHETYLQPALVQEYIPGSELQVSVLGNSHPVSLGVVELQIIDANGRERKVLRSEDWQEGNVSFLPCSAATVADKASDLARVLFRVLGMHDYARLDFRVTPSGDLYFIESATHPHILGESSFTQAARSYGLSFQDMLEKLIAASLERHGSVPSKQVRKSDLNGDSQVT
jgi:D-alanine-D-alanine ligase